MNEETWNGLLEFETRDLIEKFYEKKLKRKANAKKIREISSNFIQGREYFVNVKKANFVVKPLLLYYGVMSLTRGLTLCNSPNLYEANLKKSHGLEIKNWEVIQHSKSFENLEISINNGAFMELLESTSNKSYLKANSSGVNWQFQTGGPSVGDKIGFLDLIQHLPDLSQEYEIWTNQKFSFVQLSSLKEADEKYIFSFPKSTNKEFLEKVFNNEFFSNKEIVESESDIVVKYSSEIKYFPTPVQKWKGWMDIGDVYLIPSSGKYNYVNSLGTLFILSYVLGMLSRYFPSTWISLGRVEKGDRIYPLFRKAISFIEETYPRAVLEFLRGPYSFEKEKPEKTGENNG